MSDRDPLRLPPARRVAVLVTALAAATACQAAPKAGEPAGQPAPASARPPAQLAAPASPPVAKLPARPIPAATHPTRHAGSGSPAPAVASPPPSLAASPSAAAGSTAAAPGAPAPSSAVEPAALPAAGEDLPAASGSGRRVVYSISRQRVWTVQAGGQVERSYLVSGRPTQPDAGTYRVFSRSRHARSAVSPASMQYMVRFTRGKRTGAPIGFHDIPRHVDGSYEQTEAQLGQPLSAGCVRQRRTDAAYLWSFAPVGTTVVVTA